MVVAPADGEYVDLRVLRDGEVVQRGAYPNTPESRTEITRIIGKCNANRCNLHFGVAARANENGGALTDCARLSTLFVDIDFKTLARERAIELIDGFPLVPSFIIESGFGLSCVLASN